MTILVTGGSSGIGRAIAEHWARLGHEVFVNYHQNEAAANDTLRAIDAAGGRGVLVKADIGTQTGVDAVVAAVREATDHLDLYVHCAALAVKGGALTIDPVLLARAIAVNGTSLVSLTQGLLPVLKRGSSVVYISSQGARAVVPSYVALGPTKSLGEALIRYLAKELAPRGVRANTIAAGPLDTPAFRAVFGDQSDARLEKAAAANPAGRAVAFDDVVGAVELVAAPGAGMVQGQTIRVDGGLYL